MRLGAAIERWLEAERDQLVLWVPVAFGGGIALWWLLDRRWESQVAALLLAALGLAAVALGRGGRLAHVIAVGSVLAAAGLLLAWGRAAWVSGPVLAKPAVVQLRGTVEHDEVLAARGLVRVTLRTTIAGEPVRVRVNLAAADVPAKRTRGATVSLRARLMPPPIAAVPGAYDYARVAWFDRIAATGRGFAPVSVEGEGSGKASWRADLTRHITEALPGSAGGIAAALVTGDEGAIGEGDVEAMRRAGLAHLLSVSGLHITAVVGATMLLVLRMLALSPTLALRTRLPLIAAVAGAAAAIGYTLLTGAQVPTVRSCVAALLVLAALAMGREAITLRLVAAGAMVVLLAWPESLAGASFQLSFAAILAIVAFHELPQVASAFAPHEEGWTRRRLRGLASLLATGVVVELALMPIAVFHFHKAGLYGALANIAAIPLTTFVVMPLEAGALLLDVVGLGAPLWWLTARALGLLLWIAHRVATAPGSVVAIPSTPTAAFAAMVGGGLWVALWRTRWRWLGVAPVAIGAGWALATPAPDVLVTGDGRHVAVRTDTGLALLRERAGDYTRSMLAENGGADGEPLLLDGQRGARCSRDLCLVDLVRGGRRWRLVATRSGYLVPGHALVAACRSADVVVSERLLPPRCRPRWLKLDRGTLVRTGGVAITLASGRVATVLSPDDEHPWRVAPTLAPPARTRYRRGDRERP